MNAWNQDPRKFLVMNLKLVKGIQFSNPLGEIIASLPDVLEATVVTKWQYRLMLSLDGEQQFVEVVRDVKNDFDGEFEATDVWMFLDWLIENNLIEESEEEIADPELSFGKVERAPKLPDVIEPSLGTRTWLKVPLQLLAILLICLVAGFSSYSITPIILTMVNGENSPAIQEVDTDGEEAEEEIVGFDWPDPEIVENKAVRTPKVATPEEVAFASRAVIEMELPELPQEPSLVEKLIDMRREVAACQIRRDEYYLLDNEKGYRDEVAKISALVKEIGQIRAEIKG